MSKTELTTDLNQETHESMLAMMNSTDKENMVVALNCIENVDFDKSLVYILLLKKFSNASAEDWKSNAPKVSAKLKALEVDVDKPINFKKILQIIVQRKVPKDDIQFYLDRFGGYLFTTIKDMGYNYVESIEIKLKTDKNESIGAISKSK